jgi:phosphoenolpyruvate---glycerone phosphotransferase subunit DhaL
MSIDISDFRAAATRVAAAMERDFEALNAIDGALGDGDLGVTMTRGMRAIEVLSPTLPDDLGLALLACAQAFTKSSGSSYGTLMATGLMAMAKIIKGRTSIELSEISMLVVAARDAMMARGKAELGGKTVLDSLEAVVQASAGLSDAELIAKAAATQVRAAMEDFKHKPATIGRARIFAEKSMTMYDPGMMAMTGIVEAIAGE